MGGSKPFSEFVLQRRMSNAIAYFACEHPDVYSVLRQFDGAVGNCDLLAKGSAVCDLAMTLPQLAQCLLCLELKVRETQGDVSSRIFKFGWIYDVVQKLFALGDTIDGIRVPTATEALENPNRMRGVRDIGVVDRSSRCREFDVFVDFNVFPLADSDDAFIRLPSIRSCRHKPDWINDWCEPSVLSYFTKEGFLVLHGDNDLNPEVDTETYASTKGVCFSSLPPPLKRWWRFKFYCERLLWRTYYLWDPTFLAQNPWCSEWESEEDDTILLYGGARFGQGFLAPRVEPSPIFPVVIPGLTEVKEGKGRVTVKVPGPVLQRAHSVWRRVASWRSCARRNGHDRAH